MAWYTPTNQHKREGFTLIELLVVVLITGMLLGLMSITLGRPQTVANVTTSSDTLLADLKGQQILSMMGDTGNQTSAQPHGIYLQSTQYTLFAGSSYAAGNSYFVVNLAANAKLSTTFPSTQVVFTKGSGEVQGFVTGSNAITLTSGAVTKTITINRFGAITVN